MDIIDYNKSAMLSKEVRNFCGVFENNIEEWYTDHHSQRLYRYMLENTTTK